MKCYIIERNDTERGYPYFVIDSCGMTVGEGDSPLQAAAAAASSLYQTGSAFWHREIAQILMQSDMDVINFGASPWSA